MAVEEELKALVEELNAELAKAVPFVVRRAVELFGLEESQVVRAVKKAFSHALHITIHELVHELAREALPWLEELSEPKRTFVDEVLARLVERSISTGLRENLGLKTAVVESFEEQLSELRFYDQLKELRMSVEDLKGLYQEFLKFTEKTGGACEFARLLLGLIEQYLGEG